MCKQTPSSRLTFARDFDPSSNRAFFLARPYRFRVNSVFAGLLVLFLRRPPQKTPQKNIYFNINITCSVIIIIITLQRTTLIGLRPLRRGPPTRLIVCKISVSVCITQHRHMFSLYLIHILTTTPVLKPSAAVPIKKTQRPPKFGPVDEHHHSENGHRNCTFG